MLKKVVFLDRDGVINQDASDYIKSWEEFHFIQGSLRALRKLTDAGFSCFVVSNQSAVHRKMITHSGVDHIHHRMKETIQAHGGRIEDIFYCPHLPEEDCRCRKPKPGLLLKASRKYNISLPHAFMIGDSVRDMECGKNAGCGATILVRSGIDPDVQIRLGNQGIFPDYVAENLLGAVQWILLKSVNRPG
ncbi:MAG: D-glycero-beta-D-manno-heptose 1,7-bisphosphate 7-phosphatase [Thermodesulfobacteriota bacterium]